MTYPTLEGLAFGPFARPGLRATGVMSRRDVGVENVIALWARFFMMPLPDISSYTGYNKVDQLAGANVRAFSFVWLIV